MSGRPTAVVTGASRGIGKASAIALAQAGFDVAITARTISSGDSEFPGSLEETAAAIETAGGVAHQIAMDLLDAEQLQPVALQCLNALGHVDVLLNNAVFVQPHGGQQLFLDLDMEQVTKRVFANATAQMIFMQPIVAAMVERRTGMVLNMTSSAGYLKPFAGPTRGGWNMGYSVAKGAFHRIAPQLHFEYGDQGLVALNVQPGFVATERVKQTQGSVAVIAKLGVETDVIGQAVAHVATNPAAFDPLRTVQLQQVATTLGLIDKPAEFSP